MNKTIFQIPATITKITTMSNWLRLTIDTQELIETDAMYRLYKVYNNIGWFTFNVHQIEADDLVNLPPVRSNHKTSKSYKLRSVLYRLWEKDNYGYDNFEAYYDNYMDRMIERLKEKLL